MDRPGPAALYLHVPFCPSICPYCDFHKMLRKGDLADRWLARIERESAELARTWHGPLRSVYLGGGTPSMLEDDELRRIAGFLERDWRFASSEENTLEADPLTFDERRLALFRELGFTRLSLGVQSTQDDVLAFLGRRHSGAEGLEAVSMAVAAGFAVSVDVMTAAPGQDAAADLRRVADTGVNHVSVYSLTVEPFTPFALRGVVVDEDRAADDFALAETVLAEYGLQRYEVSNHARPGFESRHNQAYWHGEFYLALGPSAASFLPAPAARDTGAPGGGDGPGRAGHGACRTGSVPGVRRTAAPIRSWLLGDPGEEFVLDASEYALERLMTGLRTRRGVDLDDVAARGGVDVRVAFAEPLARMTAAGMLGSEGAVLRATPDGLARLNAVLREFFAARPASPSPSRPQPAAVPASAPARSRRQS